MWIGHVTDGVHDPAAGGQAAGGRRDVVQELGGLHAVQVHRVPLNAIHLNNNIIIIWKNNFYGHLPAI